jgi:hypothetical protein
MFVRVLISVDGPYAPAPISVSVSCQLHRRRTGFLAERSRLACVFALIRVRVTRTRIKAMRPYYCVGRLIRIR